jgi:hypothetical protein
MADSVDNLVLEHLRVIRADMSSVMERLDRIEINLATLGQQIGALTTAMYSGKL